MPRWLAILLGVGLPAGGLVAFALTRGEGGPAAGGAAAGGDDGDPSADVPEGLEDPTIRALTLRVRNRKRLGAWVDPRLVEFLNWWDAHGPFMITVGTDGGLRTDEAKQRALFAQKVTRAATLAETPHGRGGAVDLWVYTFESVADGTFQPDFDTNNPQTLARYRYLGEQAKARGLVWGGDFKSLVDYPHIEVPDWRTRLPFPPVGIA